MDYKKKIDFLLLEIENKFQQDIKDIQQLSEVVNVEIKYLGKKGLMNEVIYYFKKISLEEKKFFGQRINALKKNINDVLNNLKITIKQKNLVKHNNQENIDVSLPGFSLREGSIHPLNQVIEEIEDIFLSLGYEINDGLEVEKELYNFDMMNMGKDHPSRAMQDSFYIDHETLLRTHTSSVQVKSMLKSKTKSLKIISSGKVFRRDHDDAKHSHQFMQLEGFVIDCDINFIDLKKHILLFLELFFGKKQEIRFRPSYFPFTEPSIEVDLLVTPKKGDAFYLEILGAGLIHPQVMKKGGYDKDKYQGFAFGVGIERLAMLKYKIDDIRHFYNNDIRFLKQFS